MSTLWYHTLPSYYKKLGFEETYMSMRIVPLLCQGDCVLISENSQFYDYFNFCQNSLNILDVSFYDVCNMRDTFSELKEKKFDLFSVYAHTPSVENICQALQLFSMNVDCHGIMRFGKKEFIQKFSSEIMTPITVRCMTRNDLLKNWRKLFCSSVILKPSIGCGGCGVLHVTDEQSLLLYNFPYGPVVMQEYIEPDTYPSGLRKIPSVQFDGMKIIGLTDQNIVSFSYKGCSFPSCLSAQVCRDVMNMSKRLLKIIQPRGCGGFDFIIHKGQPYLVDINIGRITSVHPIWSFRSLYADGSSFVARPLWPQRISLSDFWDGLQRKGLAFSPKQKRGLFPFGWLPKSFSFCVAFADSLTEAHYMMHEASALLD